MTEVMRQLHSDISYHADAILKMFKPGAKITIVVTNDGHGDAGVVLGNDSLDRAIEEIERRKASEPS